MGTMYLRRIEPVEKDGKVILEKVPENPKQDNFGVEYRLSARLIDKNHAKTYGWNTGYPCVSCDDGPKGTIYAPKGFNKGELVFVNVEDELLSVSKMNNSSLEQFLANLEKEDILGAIDKLQGFSLIGELLHDYTD